jgi:hypothetical protein
MLYVPLTMPNRQQDKGATGPRQEGKRRFKVGLVAPRSLRWGGDVNNANVCVCTQNAKSKTLHLRVMFMGDVIKTEHQPAKHLTYSVIKLNSPVGELILKPIVKMTVLRVHTHTKVFLRS